jgi:hypothetical protein
MLIYPPSIEKYSHEKGKNRIFIMIMKDLVFVEEANGAESLLQQLMFHPMPLYRVFNLC